PRATSLCPPLSTLSLHDALPIYLTQATIDLFKRILAEFGLNDVGIVLQSYLYRTMDDARDLLKIPARIRLCKGAYDEPPEVAFPDRKSTRLKSSHVAISYDVFCL